MFMQYSISDIQVPSFMNNAAMKIFLYIVSHMCICPTIPCLWDKSLVMFRLKGVFCTVNFEKYFISFGLCLWRMETNGIFSCYSESFPNKKACGWGRREVVRNSKCKASLYFGSCIHSGCISESPQELKNLFKFQHQKFRFSQSRVRTGHWDFQNPQNELLI